MLGWHIMVFRKNADGQKIAAWQTGSGGLDWLHDLEKIGKACLVELNGGYPVRFTAAASDIIPVIASGPPHANEQWERESGDIVPDSWEGKTTLYHHAISNCVPDEMLMIEAWDES